ncbi:TPA_asm: amidohydrolase, partial [Listeria monocytogenes]|nr:amidohydrolase [Listeria monocytogenes]
MKLWKNATFYQMTAEGDQVSAVLTENGHIYAVGEARELEKQHAANITETIDLEEKVVFPGFVDAHIH